MDSNNYRGVTLLSCIGQVFTSNERLKVYCQRIRIINENQGEFRANHSTMDYIFSLKVLIDLMFKSQQKLYCVFVNYEKAFIQFWGIVYGTNCMRGVYKTSKICNSIAKMYENIKSSVLSRNVKSKYFASNAGVRQGENL